MSPAREFAKAVAFSGVQWAIDAEGSLRLTGRRGDVEPLAEHRDFITSLLVCENCQAPPFCIVEPDGDRPLALCVDCWAIIEANNVNDIQRGRDVFAWPPVDERSLRGVS